MQQRLTSPSLPSYSPTASTFHLFSSLPPELRLKIFEHAVYSCPNRLIELRTSCHPLGISYQPLDPSADPIRGKAVDVSDVEWECRTRNPPLLSVSRDSRAVGRRQRWRVRFELDHAGAGESKVGGRQVVYIDPASDVVYANLKWGELFGVLVRDLQAFGIEDHYESGDKSREVLREQERWGKGTWNLALHIGFINSFYPSLMRTGSAPKPESLAKLVVVANPAWGKEPYWEEQGKEEVRLASPREEIEEMILTEGVEMYLQWLKPTKWEAKLVRREDDTEEKEGMREQEDMKPERPS